MEKHYTEEELIEINARQNQGKNMGLDNRPYEGHYTSEEELIEINARQNQGKNMGLDNRPYEGHYTSEEELIEINARQNQGKNMGLDNRPYEEHYTSEEELIEINVRQNQGKNMGLDNRPYERHYTSPEEYFAGPSDLTNEQNRRLEEEKEIEMLKKEQEQKDDALRRLKEEQNKFQSLKKGEQLYRCLFTYAGALARDKSNPDSVLKSQKIISALNDYRNSNLTSIKTLFTELENDIDLQDALPYWKDLLRQVEEQSQQPKKRIQK